MDKVDTSVFLEDLDDLMLPLLEGEEREPVATAVRLRRERQRLDAELGRAYADLTGRTTDRLSAAYAGSDAVRASATSKGV